MSDTEITSRARFDQIRYAQVWEDADILLSALVPDEATDLSNATALSIASAGDNALALLARGFARVIAVDLSAAQLACVRLRVSAYETLRHEELVELMGSRPSVRRAELLDRTARRLDDADQAFWSARRDHVERYGLGGVGRFEHYFRVFRTRVLPVIHGSGTVRDLLDSRDPEAREQFYRERWNSWRWRLVLKLFFSEFVMGRLGRDPAFFTHAEGSLSAQVGELTRHALVALDPSANPYLHWILLGRHGEHEDALPFALRAANFDMIRSRLAHLEIHHCTMEALADQGVQADAFNLSDIFEYMSPQAHEAAYRAVLATARSGARIAYWNMMAPRRAPPSLANQVITLQALEQDLAPRDKAFFYRTFVVEQVR
ncbi:MAG: DUF3419 family protein [Pseudomonadota bacterium]